MRGADLRWQIASRGSLQAPELVRVEATNILRRLELAKQLATAEASAAHEDLMLLEMDLFSLEPINAAEIWRFEGPMPVPNEIVE